VTILEKNKTPDSSILVIGNEILSGRTKDTNIPYIADGLKNRGIMLKQVRIVLDIEADIIKNLNELRKNYDFVFTTGGIGPTHDDITAASVAKAFDVPYVVHKAAEQRLIEHYGDRLNENRMRMAFMPEGAGLIDNPVSSAPGFFIENVYCMAGMPSVMRAMFDSLLPKLIHGDAFLSQSVTCNLLEGDFASDLEAIQSMYPSVEIGSYPFFHSLEDCGATLVIQGQNRETIELAKNDVISMITKFGGIIKDKTSVS
jgi:molybdenum cofactor synthesis domain-containing protein